MASEIFKTVMKGYKKDEVLAYVDEMNWQMHALEKEAQRAKDECARVQEDLAALREKGAAPTEQQLAALRKEIREEIEQELRKEFDAALAEKDGEILRLQTEKTEQSEDGSLSELREKAREYDQYKDTLTSLLIDARKKADEILNEANSEAENIRLKAKLQFEDFTAGFGVLKQNIGATKSDIQKNLDDAAAALNVFDLRLATIQKSIEDATRLFASSTSDEAPQEPADEPESEQESE